MLAPELVDTCLVVAIGLGRVANVSKATAEMPRGDWSRFRLTISAIALTVNDG